MKLTYWLELIFLFFLTSNINAQTLEDFREKIKVTTIATANGRNHTLNLQNSRLSDITIDDQNNIYLASMDSNFIQIIHSNGTISKLDLKFKNISNSKVIYGFDKSIRSLCWNNGLLYAMSNTLLFKIDSNGNVLKIAGAGDAFSLKDGLADSAVFYNGGKLFVRDSTIYFTDYGNHSVRMLHNGMVSSYKIKARIGFSPTSKESYTFDNINGVVVDRNNNIYVAESYNNRIIKATPNDTISLFIGNGLAIAKDGVGVSASTSYPNAMTIDNRGIIYFTEGGGKIRLITPKQNVITIAGSGEYFKYGKDGNGLTASFVNPISIALDTEGNILVGEENGDVRKIILSEGFIEFVLNMDNHVSLPDIAINQDSLLDLKLKNLTKDWSYISRTNPNNVSEKQYSGKIGDQDAIFNVNINMANLRQQTEMNIYTNIGNSIDDYYFDEYALFGEDALGKIKSVRDSSYLKHVSKYPYHEKYLEGRVPIFLQSSEKYMYCRFINDSTELEGYLVNIGVSIEPIYFKLQLVKPQFPLHFSNFSWHRNTKFLNGKIKRVPATVSFNINLPERTNSDYLQFLNLQSGESLVDGWSEDSSEVNFTSLSQVVDRYRKEYNVVLGKTKIGHTRSLPGCYDNSEIITNQKDWLVIMQESFVGAIDYYGSLNTSYISYDLKNKKFLQEEDILKSEAEIEKLIEEDIVENLRYNFAFVCADGVAFSRTGNHGWTYDFYFLEWKKVMPLLNENFKKGYAYLWKGK